MSVDVEALTRLAAKLPESRCQPCVHCAEDCYAGRDDDRRWVWLHVVDGKYDYTCADGEHVASPTLSLKELIASLLAERDALLDRLKAAEADADQLATELDRWGWGDFHYSSNGDQEQSVVDALAAHAAAVSARGEQL